VSSCDDGVWFVMDLLNVPEARLSVEGAADVIVGRMSSSLCPQSIRQ
jgi:hypothetical protein